MQILVFGAALALSTATSALSAVPSVLESFGNIQFRDSHGITREITSDHRSGSPVLSPDGRTIAWIHLDHYQANSDPESAGRSSVWICNTLTGVVLKLTGSLRTVDLHIEIVNPSKLVFSLDGGYLYIESQLGATSPGIHQVELGVGRQRFITEGALQSLIRTGPYRGYLIVGQHRYMQGGGSYDASYVVRPDAGEVFMIPGSNLGDETDHVKPWLQAHGWRAW